MSSIYRLFSKDEDSSFILPELIKLQKDSCSNFIEKLTTDSKKDNIFSSIFPIEDAYGRITLDFVSCTLGEPQYDPYECMYRGVTYAVPLKVLLRLVIWDVDDARLDEKKESDKENRVVKEVREQEVYMGELPIMTDSGIFVINGIQRVVISQMHRAPGVFFDYDKSKVNNIGKYFYLARIIPYKGSWLDFEFDNRGVIYFRVDKKRKLPVSYLLKILGYSSDEIISTFHKTIEIKSFDDEYWEMPLVPSSFKGVRLRFDIIDPETKTVLIKSGIRVNAAHVSILNKKGIESYLIKKENLEGYYVAEDIRDPDSGSVIFKSGSEITKDVLNLLDKSHLKQLKILDVAIESVPYLRNTLAAYDATQEEALLELYKVLRPGEVINLESAKSIFQSTFFDNSRYDLLSVGRVRINAKLNLDFDEDLTVLTKEDIIKTIQYLINLQDSYGEIDDIDNLGNRRVRSVGEFVENQFRIGLMRIEKMVLEQLVVVNMETVMPCDLINSKIMLSVIKGFFISSSLSQFMDHTNPLAEITHKRRLSALGPGGLTKERAGFEVRDVHPTHYARICPIETPEGQNIGLISSLAIYARINKHGFIESPYRKVVDGYVINDIEYLSAVNEEKYNIAQANADIDSDGKILNEMMYCRRGYDFVYLHRDEVDYIDISAKQIVSVAASLIPFLENDDANRALMGSNMQRQAVPLLKPELPVIGTGMEYYVARGSGAAIVATRGGIVDYVEAQYVLIRSDDPKDPWVDSYLLRKFEKSNHSTCINHRPIVTIGQNIQAGDVIADGPSTDNGELALGRNLIVAFMSWRGYNFEDSILISSNIIRDDVFTSVHMEEFECIIRDTRLGPEEVTRDIPNVTEDYLYNLDEYGIVNIGSNINPGDVLVGKITPKSESPVNAEEKLLRAIFGEKSIDVKDSSLYTPPGVSGTVVDVRVFVRRGLDRKGRALLVQQSRVMDEERKKDRRISVFTNAIYDSLKELITGKEILDKSNGLNVIVDEIFLSSIPRERWWDLSFKLNDVKKQIVALRLKLDAKIRELSESSQKVIDNMLIYDDLPQGILSIVKVFIAVKHKLQPGDKMSGRHGNKGVISKIVPVEDMPYLEDGTPVDIVLNPLGVPSRMNVGQILETHLGWAAFKLGKKVKDILEEEGVDAAREFLLKVYEGNSAHSVISNYTDEEIVNYIDVVEKGIPMAASVFEAPKEEEFKRMFDLADLDGSGSETLYDGITGEPFDRKVTVGLVYMLKLHHLVDDKIHARSVGPYSLITQQPLGGKSHFGGQRFGEMECWALQAYGASYVLQEMLTVKSDDVLGRVKIYESIMKADHDFECGVPESFNVMINELRALCLNVEFMISTNEKK